MDLNDHPLIVPANHRIVARFHLLPIRVDGRYRWCQWVRVVQRLLPDCRGIYECAWVDVGYFDEVMPVGKPVIEMGDF